MIIIRVSKRRLEKQIFKRTRYCFLVKKVCQDLNLVGLDIVELTPAFDLNNNTANIAARILMEAIASMKIERNFAKR